VVIRPLGTGGLALLLLAACSTDTSTPTPPNAGTLILHAQFAAGPVLARTGHQVTEVPLANAKIVLRSADGFLPTIVTTDEHGNARLFLAPGVWTARLDVDCPTGDDPVTVGIQPGGETHTTVSCFGVG
jgi:NADPH-dependent 2,4-dienoyl-CoA reductase/sulfur reductase-like enzyme